LVLLVDTTLIALQAGYDSKHSSDSESRTSLWRQWRRHPVLPLFKNVATVVKVAAATRPFL